MITAAVILLLSLLLTIVVTNVALNPNAVYCPPDNNIFAIGQYPSQVKRVNFTALTVGASFTTAPSDQQEQPSDQDYAFYQLSYSFWLSCYNRYQFTVVVDFVSPIWVNNTGNNVTFAIQNIVQYQPPQKCDRVVGFSRNIPVLTGKVASTIPGSGLLLRVMLITLFEAKLYSTDGPLTTLMPGSYDLRCADSQS